MLLLVVMVRTWNRIDRGTYLYTDIRNLNYLSDEGEKLVCASCQVGKLVPLTVGNGIKIILYVFSEL